MSSNGRDQMGRCDIDLGEFHADLPFGSQPSSNSSARRSGLTARLRRGVGMAVVYRAPYRSSKGRRDTIGTLARLCIDIIEDLTP